MRTTTFTAGLSLIANTFAGAISTDVENTQLETRQTVTPPATCAPLHVIAIRGLDQVNDPDLYQFLIGSVNIIKSTIAGSDSVGLPYASNATVATDGINNGTAMTQQYVQEYVASCPNSKIAILGYSDVCYSNLFKLNVADKRTGCRLRQQRHLWHYRAPLRADRSVGLHVRQQWYAHAFDFR